MPALLAEPRINDLLNLTKPRPATAGRVRRGFGVTEPPNNRSRSGRPSCREPGARLRRAVAPPRRGRAGGVARGAYPSSLLSSAPTTRPHSHRNLGNPTQSSQPKVKPCFLCIHWKIPYRLGSTAFMFSCRALPLFHKVPLSKCHLPEWVPAL